MEARVLVLGTAQDGGIPHVGCSCPTCFAAREDPGLRRHVASIAVVGATGKVLLVDATPDLPAQLELLSRALDRSSPAVDGILITHAHVGHYLGLAYLGREALDVRRMPLYCTESTARFLSRNRPWAHLIDRGCVDVRLLTPEAPFAFDRVEAWTFFSPHRAEDTDTVGLEVAGSTRRLVYLPDADRFSPRLVARIEAADIALVDGTFFAPDELGHRDVGEIPHPFVADSVELLRGAAGRVLFTHLNHTNRLLHPDPAHRPELPRGFAIVEEGARFAL